MGAELSAPSGRNSEAELGTAKEPEGDYCGSRKRELSAERHLTVCWR